MNYTLTKTLDIIMEIEFKNRNYYAAKQEDGSLKYYRIAKDVHPPKSPLISYTTYNSLIYYEEIKDKDLIEQLKKYVTIHSKK